MKRILFLSQLLPFPADAGPKIRSYYVLQQLVKMYQVSLVCFVRDSDTPESIEHLRTICSQVITIPIQRSRLRDLVAFINSLISNSPLIIARDDIREMHTTVNEAITGGDFYAIHCDQLWMAQYAPDDLGQPGLLKILDEHNACFQIVQRLARHERNPLKRLVLERDWRLLKRYEKRTLRKFDKVVTVSQEDRITLTELLHQPENKGQKNPVFSTIPICVDTEQVQPVPIPAEPMSVLHLGTMFWPPNVEGVTWFIDRVWPKVLEEIPQATFVIAGKNPPRQIQERAEDPMQRIQVTGYVPNPQPILEKAGVFIVPLFSGSGMRVKILDAWRWGLPVVSTRIGAEGIDYEDGYHLLIADTAQDFAAAVIQLLNDRARSLELRQNGRRWVEQHYDWKTVYPSWAAIYDAGSTSPL